MVIPKIVKEYVGIKPGDEVFMDVREELVITPVVSPKEFAEDFCSAIKRKLVSKVDLERLVE